MLRIAIAGLVSLAASTAASAGDRPVPEPLKPWVGWALDGHEEALCTPLHGIADRRACRWPARLVLELDDRAGRFTAEWSSESPGALPLPGDDRLWPLAVELDGAPVAVFPRAGLPHVTAPVGPHSITGRFEWRELPKSLRVPPATALLAVSIRGEAVAAPFRDDQGRLWLERESTASGGESRLEIRAHRRLTDDVPLLLATRIDLEVAGERREVVLGPVLPAGFTPLAFDSPLPARLEEGRLRVQVRPGSFTLTLTAHDTSRSPIVVPAATPPWPESEVWVFEARPALRLVEVEGGVPVDPQQTQLPEEWRRLPAYRLAGGAPFTLRERRRGDADPPPDRLTLTRNLWLDFDGRGYTLEDHVSGSSRAARLEMGAGTVLGRVRAGGVDQLITRPEGSDRAGVELVQRLVDLHAESRYTGPATSLPAVHWDHDFQEMSASLNLPPGFRLFHAQGVDRVSNTWLQSWSLLDLFIVLVAATAFSRLWSWRWGAVALVTLVLAYPEAGAPRFVWLAVLIGEALTRALPAGRLRTWATSYRLLAVVSLILITVPFLVQQVRQAMYPALEQPWRQVGATDQAAYPASIRGRLAEAVTAEVGRSSASVAEKAPPAYYQEAQVQTGPGLPQWHWNTVSFTWNGPVERDQELRLLLLSPPVNFVLGFVRTGLTTLLVVCVLGVPPGLLARLRRGGGAAALGFLATVAGSGPAEAGEIPPPELLEELRRRLLEAPACAPTCASAPRLRVELAPERLALRLEIDAAARTAVPLPGDGRHWLPETVSVDGRPATALRRVGDGPLWLVVDSGKHQVVLAGALPARDTVQVPLPLRPHRVEVVGDGWSVAGVRDDASADESLELTRIRGEHEEATAALEPATLPPFVRVERTLRLALDWRVETRVVRLSPTGTAVVAAIPLLANESVTTAGVRVADGHVQLSMGPGLREVSWQSVLAEAATIELKAPEQASWVELWRLDKLPIWHLEASGIPPIHSEATERREWRPWPGETVQLAVSRPPGVAGQTVTIDRAVLSLNPGRRATDAELALSIRTSRGGQHIVTLPDGAVVQSIAIDGRSQPSRQDGRSVTVPLVPGGQEVAIAWRRPGGTRVAWRTPEVDIGAPAVNAVIRLTIPRDRWILLLLGPRLGPTVLFWSLLVVLILVAVGLGQLPLTPLGSRQWLLLAIGLTQVDVTIAALVAGWLLALGWRRQSPRPRSVTFDLVQILLALWTVVALGALLVSIQQGLLGHPDMQIQGNGSSRDLLRFYQDRTDPILPQAQVFSVPVLFYRLAMLSWALWLSSALLSWLRWGFQCFTEGGLWRPLPRWRRKRAEVSES